VIDPAFADNIEFSNE